MAKLTALQIRNQKTPCRLGDGQGLFFEITSTGVKRWVHRYKIAGKSGIYVIGRYPDLSLEKARQAHRDSRELVKQGINPAQKRMKDKAGNIARQEKERLKRDNSFEKVALEWYALAQKGKHKGNARPWSAKHTKDVLSSFERDVFPHIGDIPIDKIAAHDLLKIIDSMTSRGVYDNTRKAMQRISQIFNYAIIKRRCGSNPAASLQGLLPSHEIRHNPALFDKDLKELLEDLTGASHLHLSTYLAIRFTLLTACRSAEVRLATWGEIDREARELHISGNRTKRGRAHIVPLSRQAMVVLDKAGEAFGQEGIIFPSPRDWSKPLSDNTLSKALRNLGHEDKYRGKQTIHGLRSCFRTMAGEHTSYDTEILEISINHMPGTKTEQAYNHSKYLKKRHQIMQWWAEKLDALEHGAKVISIKNQA